MIYGVSMSAKFHNKGVTAKYFQSNELAPDGIRGLFFSIYIFSITDGTELIRQPYVVQFQLVRWFQGLTCDFGQKMAKKNNRADKDNAISHFPVLASAWALALVGLCS
jgi:hypothetical protein